MIKQVS